MEFLCIVILFLRCPGERECCHARKLAIAVRENKELEQKNEKQATQIIKLTDLTAQLSSELIVMRSKTKSGSTSRSKNVSEGSRGRSHYNKGPLESSGDSYVDQEVKNTVLEFVRGLLKRFRKTNIAPV